MPLDRSPEEAGAVLQRAHITFLFAQRFHPAMKVVGPVRGQLGVRIDLQRPWAVNESGLRQPRADRRGAARKYVDLVSTALAELGAEAVAVIHARSGLDEIAGDGPTQVSQYQDGVMRRWTLEPGEYGVHATLEQLKGGDAPSTNAEMLVGNSARREVLRARTSRRAQCGVGPSRRGCGEWNETGDGDRAPEHRRRRGAGSARGVTDRT